MYSDIIVKKGPFWGVLLPNAILKFSKPFSFWKKLEPSEMVDRLVSMFTCSSFILLKFIDKSRKFPYMKLIPAFRVLGMFSLFSRF